MTLPRTTANTDQQYILQYCDSIGYSMPDHTIQSPDCQSSATTKNGNHNSSNLYGAEKSTKLVKSKQQLSKKKESHRKIQLPSDMNYKDFADGGIADDCYDTLTTTNLSSCSKQLCDPPGYESFQTILNSESKSRSQSIASLDRHVKMLEDRNQLILTQLAELDVLIERENETDLADESTLTDSASEFLNTQFLSPSSYINSLLAFTEKILH